jgi:hypothetical protein
MPIFALEKILIRGLNFKLNLLFRYRKGGMKVRIFASA